MPTLRGHSSHQCDYKLLSYTYCSSSILLGGGYFESRPRHKDALAGQQLQRHRLFGDLLLIRLQRQALVEQGTVLHLACNNNH